MRLTIDREETTPKEPMFQKEKKPFRELTFSQKTAYIWDYYKWWIIGPAFTIFIIINAITTMIDNSKEVVLYSAFLNSSIAGQESTTLMDDFVEYANLDLKNKKITLDTSMSIRRDISDTNSVSSSQKLLILFSSDKLDVLVCDRENFEFYVSQGCFLRLDELLPDNRFQEYYVEGRLKDSDENHVYGITLRDSKIIKDEKAFVTEPILAICTNTKQSENAVKFVEYLLSELEPNEDN